MALVTLCPGCGTTYKVYPEQLQIQNGLVRCGKCQVVFNGLSTLITIDESEIEYLTTSIDQTEPVEFEDPSGPTEGVSYSSYNELPTAINVVSSDCVEDAAAQRVGQAGTAESIEDQESSELGSDFLSDIQSGISLHDRLWFAGCVVLILILIGQGIYIFRGELAAQVPQARSFLERCCNILNCSVPLPEHIQFFSIVSSDLQVKNHDSQPDVATLTAVIRNHATYAQALPTLKLFLTSRDNQLLASRLFTSADYLSEADKAKTAILPNQEIIIQLYLDNNHLKPAGYRLQLLFI